MNYDYITVGRLRKLVEEINEQIEGYEDDTKIELTGNTYFLGGCRFFLGIAGSDGGYLNLRGIEEAVHQDDEDC